MDIAAKIKDGFPGKRVVIIGDLVADQFLRGTISRVSREAPVFILRHDETETLAGAAANAAVNVASLGGEPRLVGLVGKDAAGGLLLAELERNRVDRGFLVADESIRTTTKIRVLAGQHYAQRQQVIRIDYENKEIISPRLRDQLRKNLEIAADRADAIIISDYNYGVADAELGDLAREIASAQSIPLLIDSRFRLSEFPNASSATPNQEEVEQILGKDFSDEDCSLLRETLGFESLLVTCGNKGMLLVERGRPPVQIAAIGSDEPVDVTGAGDTVIAVYGLSLASGLSFSDAATVANHAGGIVVMKKGTASVTTAELLDSIRSAGRSTARQSAT